MALLVTTTEAALPSMKAGASIINTAALSARHLTPGQDALAAAVADTTQGWAEILSSRGIRANAVVGGPLLDPNVDADLADPDGAAPRGCEAELDAFVYLASQESSHVSGSVVSVSRSFADPGTEAGFEGKEVPDKDR